MDYTVNDRGEEVIAVGAPGSPARVKVEYPDLISKINSFWYIFSDGDYEKGIPDVIQMIREAGIKDYSTTNSIIVSTYFGQLSVNYQD